MTVGSSAVVALTCSYEPATFVYSCLGTSSRLIDRYSSVAAFVDEAQSTGRILARSSVREVPGYSAAQTTNTFDGSERLIGYNTQVGSGPGFESATYTSWDDRGRPVAGTTLVQNIVVTCRGTAAYTYDDTNRLVAKLFTSVSGCPGGGSRLTLSFDANGNLVREVDGGGVVTTFEITATDRICK